MSQETDPVLNPKPNPLMPAQALEASTQRHTELQQIARALSFSEEALSTQLGLTLDQVTTLRDKGEITAFKLDGEEGWRYPVWQIYDRQIIEGAGQIGKVAGNNLHLLTVWFERPSPNFDNMPPYKRVRMPGGAEIVVKELEAIIDSAHA